MSDTTDLEILRIAEELFDLPEAERLERLGKLDLEPRVEAGVRRLLGYDRRDDAFGDDQLGNFGQALIRKEDPTPTSGAGAEAAPSGFLAAMPERIGPYRILRELGRGGMGVVYEAEQLSPRRRVALKVILPHLATEELRARFQREAEVLGQLQHIGIAHIYEAVLDDVEGQPFFAMEYIEGEPLDAFASTRELDIRQRLALVARICDAVQHAHMKGILHRDLKPGNILVVEGQPEEGAPTDEGSRSGTGDRGRSGRRSTNVRGVAAQPKILDFGIARATDADLHTATLQTEAGRIIGTLAYMSPEQLGADSSDLDTRCDVYALGVILFELLTGKLPHDVTGQNLIEIARVIRETDAPSAGDVDARLRGDIATLVAKALDKDRDRRYGSASELAADIRRYLNDEPIEARPASAMYQLTKFVRRHRALTATVAVALIATISLTIWALVNAGIANENARTAEENARVATERERELSRLADQRELRVLIERMDQLWPAAVENGPEMDTWLDEADALVSRIPEHTETLESLKLSATTSDGTLDFRGDNRTQWWYETLDRLIGDLRVFAGEDWRGKTVGSMRFRREQVTRVERETTGSDAERAWSEARDAIRASRTYDGLDLPPQPGLVPLGVDPESGLYEFWHVASGVRPKRDRVTGRFEMLGEVGVVLVLIPGGEFDIGTSPEQRAAAKMMIYGNEVPSVRVTLDPFFMGKYEMGHGPWERTMGTKPNTGLRGLDDADYPRFPLTLVDWPTAVEGLRRMGLELPTEAQWEYACRGGTSTLWSVGDDKAELVHVANLADQTHGRVIQTQFKAELWDDGFLSTSPLGSFAPNRFGLHDVHGNVYEWTRDQFHPEYEGGLFREGDGFRGIDPELPETRVLRGGCFQTPASFARSAVRSRMPIDHADFSGGLRPSMSIVR